MFQGTDGLQRPYAMVFSQQDGPTGARLRKPMAETGSFGRSTRRSRSRTGTPARREDPNLAAADKVFSNWFATLETEPSSPPPSKSPAGSGANSPGAGPAPAGSKKLPTSNSQTSFIDDSPQPASGTGRFGVAATLITTTAVTTRQATPTEVVLRGYRSATQQYAVIDHFERLAGRICEDYPRDPPAENRRYKSELRDPALAQRLRTPLTPTERQCVNNARSGEHWVKITFESAEVANAALQSSPQSILGCLVHATLWQGTAQKVRDEAIFDPVVCSYGPDGTGRDETTGQAWPQQRVGAQRNRRPSLTNSRSGSDRGWQQGAAGNVNNSRRSDFASWQPGGLSEWGETVSPQPSQSSSRTLDTGTLTADSGTLSSGTITGRQWGDSATANGLGANGGGGGGGLITASRNAAAINNGEFCHLIPTARRAKLAPAEQALLPAPSFAQRMANHVPLLRWFGSALIGDEVPRTDAGEFDWGRASLYWKCMWYLDWLFNIFGGEIRNADKED